MVSAGTGASQTLCTLTSLGSQQEWLKQARLIRNAYKKVKKSGAKCEGHGVLDGKLLHQCTSFRGREHCLVPHWPPEAHALQAPNKHGRHSDPLMSHPALASPWRRQQETHFHKRAKISSSINNTCNWVLGWICYPVVPVQTVWWWPITPMSH